MKIKDILDFFELTYPGTKISKLPEKNPTEIICEIEPSSEHADIVLQLQQFQNPSPIFTKHLQKRIPYLRVN